MRARRHASGGGFTLLEVMVAMAILAMSLMAAFDVVGGALRNHERTRHLELATMLARAKLAEVEARFEEDGFRDFDESDEGTFDEEGHPEVSWKVATVKPTMELGAEGVVKALTGADGGLEGLLGMAPGSLGGAGGKGAGAAAGAPISPLAGQALAAIQTQLTALGEEIKKGVREVRLTVSWKEGPSEESFTVVTHMVVLVPGSQAATAGTGGLPAGGGLPPAGPPGFNTAGGKGSRFDRTKQSTQEGQ
ncbi:MAG: prepilin-type N-terminal cleavage/methylation domain-containing protein [Anaeromyxobacteraceae bacterium]|nr:prepilin-type N-terminal cleavage/methylation domain-containing protein [Anaeromyxobacteraceae bacterium]